MSGPKRNPDKLNTIGVVVVGCCGAVLVYVTIVALQAFYMDDTSEIQTMADYGGQDIKARTTRASQMANLTSPSQPNARAADMPQTYRIPIKHAMKYIAEEAKRDPSLLVPAIGRSSKATVMPVFGRPIPIATPGAGSAPAPATDPATDPGAASATDPGTAPATAPGADPGAGSAAAPAPGAGSATTPAPATAPAPATPPRPRATPTNPAGGSAARGNVR